MKKFLDYLTKVHSYTFWPGAVLLVLCVVMVFEPTTPGAQYSL